MQNCAMTWCSAAADHRPAKSRLHMTLQPEQTGAARMQHLLLNHGPGTPLSTTCMAGNNVSDMVKVPVLAHLFSAANTRYILNLATSSRVRTPAAGSL